VDKSSNTRYRQRRVGVRQVTTEKNSRGLDLDIAGAVEGHLAFKRQFERDREFFKSLAQSKQKPRLLWIGCSDSRVVPAQITSADPGELFEIRNIANIVPPLSAGSTSVGAAIEYAVVHLGIDDIVVCGHTGCGGLAALRSPDAPAPGGHLGRWLEHTRPAHALIAAARLRPDLRPVETVKAHIHFQIDNLLTYPVVQAAMAAGRLGVHGWLYDMEKGDILAYDREQGDWRGLVELGR
jgi:carbonic anhydrase